MEIEGYFKDKCSKFEIKETVFRDVPLSQSIVDIVQQVRLAIGSKKFVAERPPPLL